jgi:hypothetical protein
MSITPALRKLRHEELELEGSPGSIVSSRPAWLYIKTLYTLSSTKLDIRTKQFLPGSKGVGGRGKG